MNELPKILANSHKGKRVLAKYIKHAQESLNGNPCTEVFKPRWDRDEATDLMRKSIKAKPNRNASPVDRIYACQDLLFLFEPLPIHWHVERAFSDNLRRGYQARNPLSKDYWSYLEEHEQLLLEVATSAKTKNEARAELANLVSKADIVQEETGLNGMENSQDYDPSEGDDDIIPLVLAVLGDSGTGKSRTMRLIARLYPKVIVHKNYPDDPYHLMDGMQQIVTIFQEAPANGSLKTFCLNIFSEIDNLVGTNYRKEFGKGSSLDVMLSFFAYLVRMYCIGMFIFDELQRFVGTPDEQKAISFFETIITGLGVPCVLIGTEAAYELLSQTFSSGRRLSGTRGLIEFKRMQNDALWEYFLEMCIWEHQYTAEETPFSKELSDALYYETQGVIDLTIKLYIMVQIHLIEQRERNPKLNELITPKVIHDIAQQGFKHLQGKLQKMRLGKDEEIKPEELRQVDIQQFIRNMVAKMLEDQKSDLAFLQSQKNQAKAQSSENAEQEKINEVQPQSSENARTGKGRGKKSETEQKHPTGIEAVFYEAKNNNESFYEALHARGYIHQLQANFPELQSL